MAQVTLTEAESKVLQSLSQRTGKTEEELLHDAVVRFLDEQRQTWLAQLRSAMDMWKDRDDLPDLRELREESNRYG